MSGFGLGLACGLGLAWGGMAANRAGGAGVAAEPQPALMFSMSAGLTNPAATNEVALGARSPLALRVAFGAGVTVLAALGGLLFSARKALLASGLGAAPTEPSQDDWRGPVEALLAASQPAEAVALLKTELERHPGDGAGLALLAEIQATGLRDLGAATETTARLTHQPGLPIGTVVTALSKLAQWRQEQGSPPELVCQPLEEIRQRFPRSAHAEAARRQIAALLGQPATDTPPETPPVKLNREP